jgi:tetratricopeptide (TPR) repeat protein
MKKKRKFTLIILSVIGLVFITGAVKFVFDTPFRNEIPVHPDFETISKPLQEQISAARFAARFNPTANNIGRLGMVYYSCSEYENAAQCFQLAVKKNNEKWIWSYYLGYLNLELGDAKAAIDNFSLAQKYNPENPMPVYYMGQAMQTLGLNDGAEMLFKEIVSGGKLVEKKVVGSANYFPVRTYAMFQLGRIYENSGRLNDAEKMYKEILEEQIAFRPAHRFLGNVYKTKGDLALSEKFLTRANDLSEYTFAPSDALIDSIATISRSDEYLLKQIDNAVRSENFVWALRLCDHAITYFPENKYLITKVMSENFRQNNDQKALDYLDRHFGYYTEDFNELRDIVDILYAKGFQAEARKYVDQLKKLMPENSALALWLFEKGMKDDAILTMNDLLKNDPENATILSDVVYMLLQLGRNDLAAKYLAILQRVSTQSAKVLVLNGMLAEKQGKLNEALADYEKAFRLDPKDFMVIDYLTNLYIQNEMWAKAIDYCRLGLDALPNNPVLLERIGKLLIACPDPAYKNVEEGIEFSERAFINYRSLLETKLFAGRNLAIAYASSGNKQKAVDYINQTLALAKGKIMYQEYVEYFNSLRKLYRIL